MATPTSNTPFLLLSITLIISATATFAAQTDLGREFDLTWGEGRGKIVADGQLLTLTLDHTSGSGFQSKNKYLYGKLDMQLKLVPGNSAGTVTAYFVIKTESSLHFLPWICKKIASFLHFCHELAERLVLSSFLS